MIKRVRQEDDSKYLSKDIVISINGETRYDGQLCLSPSRRTCPGICVTSHSTFYDRGMRDMKETPLSEFRLVVKS